MSFYIRTGGGWARSGSHICLFEFVVTCVHSYDATLLSKTVFIQFLSRRGISNMFDIKDKLSGQIVADESCRVCRYILVDVLYRNICHGHRGVLRPLRPLWVHCCYM